MNSQNKYIMQADTNAFNNYYNNTDNNFERNQDKNISNNAKELIKNFKNQYLTNNSINQRIFTTEINQDSQNYSNPIQHESNKAREIINTNDFYLNHGVEIDTNMTPMKNNYINDVNLVGQENIKLEKQAVGLVLENQNLQNKTNENFPININENNTNYYRTITPINRHEKNFREKIDNNFNFNNNYKNNMIFNNNNNSINMPLNDKKFMEDSIESIIKTNMKFPQNNNDISNKTFDIKKYDKRNPKSNKNSNINLNNYNTNTYNIKKDNIYSTLTNDYNNNNYNKDDKYLTIMNEYNQLLDDYKINKVKLDTLKQELENKKGLSNKYKNLKNNYIELQNRNKELIITIQKMKNDNTILTKHIEELNNKKKKIELNYNKLKNKNKNKINEENNNNINELKILRNKYIE